MSTGVTRPPAGDPAKTTPLSQGTKADEIATALEEAIAAGKLPAGTVLRQDHLSEEFGVSRTPVREALRKVEALGLVDFSPNRGARVVGFDTDRWFEAYLVRGELEALAAELAAPRITKESLEALESASADFSDLTDRLGRPLEVAERERLTFAWLSVNARFHDEILAAADSPLLVRLTANVRRIISGQPLWTPDSDLAAGQARSADEHLAIHRALAARNAIGARELAREHVRNSWTLVELTLKAGGLHHPPVS
jgi:DNA-binding GntR family transcriptional regulator